MDCFFDCCDKKKVSINTSIQLDKLKNRNKILIDNLTTTNQNINENSIKNENESFNQDKKEEDDFTVINYPEVNKTESNYSINYIDDLAKIRGKSIETNNYENEVNDNEKNNENNRNKCIKSEFPKFNLLDGNRRKKIRENALGSITTKENSTENDSNYIHSFRNPKREMTINNYKNKFYSEIEENLSVDNSNTENFDYNKNHYFNKIYNYSIEKNRRNSNKNIIRKISNEKINGDTISLINSSE